MTEAFVTEAFVTEAFCSRSCEACGSESQRVLFTQRFAAAEACALLRGYEVVVCGGCGFCFASRLPTQAAFDDYYQRRSKYDLAPALTPSSGAFEPNRPLLELIKATLEHQAGVVELGCATGELLVALRQSGYGCLAGIDPSPRSVAHARQVHQLSVFQGHLASLGEAAFLRQRGVERVDALVLANVLEHLVDLAGALRTIRSALVCGGALFVQVPDVAGFEEFFDAPFQEFSTEHINYFSSASLPRLLARAGFTPESVRSEVVSTQGDKRYRVLAAVCRKSELSMEPPSAASDTISEQALLSYVQRSRAEEQRVHQRLHDLTADGAPILVWGTGTHTLRLLESGALDGVPIAAFVDSNPNYQGARLAGRAILAPQELGERTEPILVSSQIAQRELVVAIRETWGRNNRLLLLY